MNDFSVHRIIGRGGFGVRMSESGHGQDVRDEVSRQEADQDEAGRNTGAQREDHAVDCPFIVCMTYAFHTPDKLRLTYSWTSTATSEYQTWGWPAISPRRSHTLAGTHGYMAPEVLSKGTGYDSSADWFSFGCMLFKLLKGHSPFQRGDAGHVQPESSDADEVKDHVFFAGIDWQQVYHQKYTPPLIPPRGELTETDQAQYKDFPLVISERWQGEVAETVFDTVNQEADKMEMKKKSKQKQKFDADEKESDCILHGYIKKLGGPFASAWQTRYAKLYPNRLELHLENSAKPEMILLDSVEEVSSDLVSVKGEQTKLV
ncbi:unnamed protein product [Leptidea sinapis]|uniref:Protein kinase domain-containing protein n=1 Tax=Leptidea sinapis TaxID=189913 RepID=A0A5E4PVN5_9NEOP|nr:unnamed protein product [Leptidea sinapis]